MTADERFKALLLTMPTVKSDFDADGELTDEAASRAADWAWEQLSEAERREFSEAAGERRRLEQAAQMLDELVAEGKAETFIDEEGVQCYRML